MMFAWCIIHSISMHMRSPAHTLLGMGLTANAWTVRVLSALPCRWHMTTLWLASNEAREIERPRCKAIASKRRLMHKS